MEIVSTLGHTWYDTSVVQVTIYICLMQRDIACVTVNKNKWYPNSIPAYFFILTFTAVRDTYENVNGIFRIRQTSNTSNNHGSELREIINTACIKYFALAILKIQYMILNYFFFTNLG